MIVNLTPLYTEIVEHLASRGLVVFHSDLRGIESPSAIYWEVEKHPDFREFVEVAVAAGAQVITLFSRTFDAAHIESASEEMEELGVDPKHRLNFEAQLRDLRKYDGMVGHIELTFNHAQRDYIFDLRTPWYDDYTDLLEELHMESDDEDDEEENDDSFRPGYFSRN